MGTLQVLCLAFVLGTATAMESWREELLRQENGHRADHSSPALKYNPELEKAAQEWAEHLSDICTGIQNPHAPDDRKLSPSLFSVNDEQQGENIQKYMSISNNLDYKAEPEKGALGSAYAWYREVEDYPWGDFDGKDNPKMIYHFSQQVWEGTKEVGYGMASCNTTYHTQDPEEIQYDGMPEIVVWTVARYLPTGNVIGAFKQNVHPKR